MTTALASQVGKNRFTLRSVCANIYTDVVSPDEICLKGGDLSVMVEYRAMLRKQILKGFRKKFGLKKGKIRSGWYEVRIPYTVYFKGSERWVIDSVKVKKGEIVSCCNFREDKESPKKG